MFDIELTLITVSAYLFFIAMGILFSLKSDDAVLRLFGSIVVFTLSLSLALSGIILIGIFGMFLGVLLFFAD